MTRQETLDELRRLAGGLESSRAGAWKLLERTSQHDEAEALRDLLVERGAEALLEELA